MAWAGSAGTAGAHLLDRRARSGDRRYGRGRAVALVLGRLHRHVGRGRRRRGRDAVARRSRVRPPRTRPDAHGVPLRKPLKRLVADDAQLRRQFSMLDMRRSRRRARPAARRCVTSTSNHFRAYDNREIWPAKAGDEVLQAGRPRAAGGVGRPSASVARPSATVRCVLSVKRRNRRPWVRNQLFDLRVEIIRRRSSSCAA